MTPAMVVVGLGVVPIGLVDLAWTTIAAGSGAGPLSRRLARSTWRTALAVHRRRPSHRFLTAAGVGVVVIVFAAWITTVLAGDHLAAERRSTRRARQRPNRRAGPGVGAILALGGWLVVGAADYARVVVATSLTRYYASS